MRRGKKADVRLNLQEIDNIFDAAGLVRGRRGPAGGARSRVPMQPMAQEELRRPAQKPRLAENGVEWLAVEAWGGIPWLWHGFSTRRGGLSRCYGAAGRRGDLNLGFTAEDAAETVTANRRLLAEAITGNAETPLLTMRQFHSSVTILARAGCAPRARGPKGDGMLTAEPGILLGILTADCVPVLVADRRQRVVAAFHAGWRGAAKRIVETGVGRMRLEYGSRPEDLTAAIGPAIGACCYAVGDEVLSEFESQFAYARALFFEVDSADEVRRRYPMLFLTQRAPGHSPMGPFLHVDLKEANRRQLLDAGVRAGAIHVVDGCTSCNRELFFSHRGSQGRTGRMLSVIGIRER